MLLRYTIACLAFMIGSLPMVAQSKGQSKPAPNHTGATAQHRGGGEVPNDDCAQAVMLTPGLECVPHFANSLGATQSMAPVVCMGFDAGVANDVWFSFTATGVAHGILVQGIGGYDAIIEVFSGTCGALNSIGCVDATFPSPGNPASEELLQTGLTMGTTYYVRVYNYDDESPDQSFSICIQEFAGGGEPPLNNECAGALELPVAVACEYLYTSTTFATQSMAPVNCEGEEAEFAYDVWFSFVATGMEHTINVQGVDIFDAVVELFSGACGNLTSMACMDATFPGAEPATEELVQADLITGQTYHVRVYDFNHSGFEHPFGICITGEIPTGINNRDRAEFMVFPNPTDGNITIGNADFTGNIPVELFDMTGRMVHGINLAMSAGEHITLPLEGRLGSGTYQLVLTTPEGRVVRPVVVR